MIISLQTSGAITNLTPPEIWQPLKWIDCLVNVGALMNSGFNNRLGDDVGKEEDQGGKERESGD